MIILSLKCLRMKCKICFNETSELLINDSIYYKCENCEYIFLNKFADSKTEKERYELHNNTLENQGYVNMFERFISNVPISGKVLDFGSGPVPVLATLLKRKGVDVDIYDIYFAKDESYKQKKYDTILATEVFEHLKDPLGVISELLFSLNSNGILAVMTGFIPTDFVNWRYRKDFTHIGFFTHKTMQFLANKYNLEIIKMNEKNLCVFRKK